jgi:hypothetical protein
MAVVAVVAIGALVCSTIVRTEVLIRRCDRELRDIEAAGLHWNRNGILVDENGEPWA